MTRRAGFVNYVPWPVLGALPGGLRAGVRDKSFRSGRSLTDCSAGLLGHAIPRVASSLSGALSTTVIDDSPGDHGYIALGLGNMSDRMLGMK